METINFKIVEEGMNHPIEILLKAFADDFSEHDIQVGSPSDFEVKVKFTFENDQDIVLLQLRGGKSKQKLNEKVIFYHAVTWKEDIVAEVRKLLYEAHILSD